MVLLYGFPSFVLPPPPTPFFQGRSLFLLAPCKTKNKDITEQKTYVTMPLGPISLWMMPLKPRLDVIYCNVMISPT